MKPFVKAVAALVLTMAASSSVQAAGKPALADALVGRAWIETTPPSGLPGVMLVFLPGGTLLMDSCWETYALRKWTRTAPDAVAWDEDGARITATVVSVSASQLSLRIKAGKDSVEHRYSVAKVSYVCPDMKR